MKAFEFIIIVNLSVFIAAVLCYHVMDSVEANKIAEQNLISPEMKEYKEKYHIIDILKVTKEQDVE